MATRSERLNKLLVLQQKLKAFHETRHAGFIAASANALEEADDLRRRSDGADSFSSVFPGLYSKHIADALARSAREAEKAKEEARLVATATMRMNRVERAFREARGLEERQTEDRERLELIQNRLAGK